MNISLSLSQIMVAGFEKSLDFYQELICPDKVRCKRYCEKIIYLKSFFLFTKTYLFIDTLMMSLGNGLQFSVSDFWMF